MSTDACRKCELTFEEVLPPVYCGCRGKEPGHYFHTRGMLRMPYQKCRGLYAMDYDFAPVGTQEEGAAWFHSGQCKGIPYVVISFWDRSVDRRPGSHSTFLLTGAALGFTEALALCREHFPEVFRRFKFEVRLVKNCVA